MDLKPEEIERYKRHIQLDAVGTSGQEKLKQAKVLVIGAGGLGCPILQYLAAAGIGTLGIVDNDTVEESNLQRQVLFNSLLVGTNKALAAKQQLEALNPLIKVQAHPIKLDANNACSLFESYDVLVDATDNFESRYIINDAALLCGKPFVFGAIHRFEGQLTVFNYQKGPTYRCLFPRPPKAASIPNCNEAGVLGVLPGIVGTHQANEVLKIILGIGETLSGRLMLINTLNNHTSFIGIKRNEEEMRKVLSQGMEKEMNNTFSEISVIELKERMEGGESFNFLDVRAIDEQPKIEKLQGLNIPLSKLEINNFKILENKNLIIYCQTGLRSKKASNLLANKGINNLYNLSGGINAWIQEEIAINKD